MSGRKKRASSTSKGAVTTLVSGSISHLKSDSSLPANYKPGEILGREFRGRIVAQDLPFQWVVNPPDDFMNFPVIDPAIPPEPLQPQENPVNVAEIQAILQQQMDARVMDIMFEQQIRENQRANQIGMNDALRMRRVR
jgi:hypothetical protein